MSRIIKFRAWNTTAQCMIYDIQQEPMDSMHYSFADYLEDKNNYVVMQFTGRLDKNGKEIFDGDIVEDSYGRQWEVFWREKFCGFNLKKVDGSGWIDLMYGGNVGSYKIIGNIHESPNLLKEQGQNEQ
jgi:uncharacterized phage protein (TIGR01671 family)